jgi:hypothetical protein
MKFCHKILATGCKLSVLGYGFWVMGCWFTRPALAATFSLDPTSGSFAKDQTFQVKINVDTSSDLTTSAEALLLFDGNIVDVSDISYGSFYPQYFKNIS